MDTQMNSINAYMQGMDARIQTMETSVQIMLNWMRMIQSSDPRGDSSNGAGTRYAIQLVIVL